MRFYGIALLMSAALLDACGGESKPATDSAAAKAPAASATTPAATTPTTMPGAGAVAAAPITGKTIEIKMIGDASGYKFEPATVIIKKGDALKFINVTGGPHNIAFLNVADATAKAQLDANMPNTPQAKMGELSSPALMNPNEAYIVSFGNMAAGTYEFTCTPHAAMNMKGAVTVQ